MEHPQVMSQTVEVQAQTPAQYALDEIAVAERRQKSGDELRKYAVGRTAPSQWHQFGEVVYMMGSAAENLAEALGIKIIPLDIQGTGIPGRFLDLPGGGYQCIRVVTARYRDLEFTDHGDCDSFDDFLAKRTKELEQRGATPEQVGAICRSDVSKKALANAISRAVSGVLGLRGMSWEDLHALGLPREGVKRTEFARGGKGGKVASLAIAEALKAAIGSKIALGGIVRRLERREKVTKITLGDTAGAITVALVTSRSPAPDWLAEGIGVFFPEVAVGEYQGAKQWTAFAIEQTGEVAADDSPPREAPPPQQSPPAGTAPPAARGTRPAPRQMTADEYEDLRRSGGA